MKFFVSREVHNNRLLVWVLVVSTLFFAALWVTNLLLYSKVGFGPDAILGYYLGSPEEFIPGKTYLGMLEEAHFHLFAMGMLFMTLGHLLLFTPLPVPLKGAILIGFAVGAFGDILGGFLIVYGSPRLVYAKIFSFWLLQVSNLAMLVSVAVFLGNSKDRNGHPG